MNQKKDVKCSYEYEKISIINDKEAGIMTITKSQSGNGLTVAIEGRLDTTTAPKLEEELKASLDGIADLTMDLGTLEYISSAGLRVLLSAQKIMNRQGKLTIRNVKPEVMDIFEVTGFADILNIEA